MSYNNQVLIGKIRSINYSSGVGEIVTTNNSYMFTVDCISSPDKLLEGDIVKFRAESVHSVNKAYFIDKVDLNKSLEDYQVLKSKHYNN